MRRKVKGKDGAFHEDGAVAERTIRVTITNRAPKVKIESPANGAEFSAGAVVLLRGRARDSEDGSLTGNALEWLLQEQGSSARRKVATGPIANLTGLPGGTHTIFLRATDQDGLKREASVQIRVVNQAPRVTIASPADMTVVKAGKEVRFVGAAFDPESGEVTGSGLTWTARRKRPNGFGPARELGKGKRIKVSSFRKGMYRIVLTATDPHDSSIVAEATIRLRVNPGPNGNGHGPGGNSSGITGGVNNASGSP